MRKVAICKKGTVSSTVAIEVVKSTLLRLTFRRQRPPPLAVRPVESFSDVSGILPSSTAGRFSRITFLQGFIVTSIDIIAFFTKDSGGAGGGKMAESTGTASFVLQDSIVYCHHFSTSFKYMPGPYSAAPLLCVPVAERKSGWTVTAGVRQSGKCKVICRDLRF